MALVEKQSYDGVKAQLLAESIAGVAIHSVEKAALEARAMQIYCPDHEARILRFEALVDAARDVLGMAEEALRRCRGGK